MNSTKKCLSNQTSTRKRSGIKDLLKTNEAEKKCENRKAKGIQMETLWEDQLQALKRYVRGPKDHRLQKKPSKNDLSRSHNITT